MIDGIAAAVLSPEIILMDSDLTARPNRRGMRDGQLRLWRRQGRHSAHCLCALLM